MSWIVLKFGGTSVSSYKNWSVIVERIQYFQDLSFNVMVVISALSGITNLLQDICNTPDTDKRKLLLDEIRLKHSKFIIESNIVESELGQFEYQFTSLEKLVSIPVLSIEQKAEIMGYGELFSTSLGNVIINRRVECKLLDSRDILVSKYQETASEYSNFMNCDFDIDGSKLYLTSGVYLTQGFICTVNRKGIMYPAVLGRGGSDTSGSIYAYILNALKYEIWTDVNGIYTIDPRVSDKWKMVSHVDYSHAYNIAFTGGKVIHERCLYPLQCKNIVCEIKNTFDPHSKDYTTISVKHQRETVITGKAGYTFIEFRKIDDAIAFASRQYQHYIYDINKTSVLVEGFDFACLDFIKSCSATWWSKCYMIGMSDLEQYNKIEIVERLGLSMVYYNKTYHIIQSNESLSTILRDIYNCLPHYINKNGKSISIIGNGAVGLEIIKTLYQREFPVHQLLIFGNKSVGMNLDTPYGVLPIQRFDLERCKDTDICFIASTSDFAKEYAKQIASGRAVVIDNSNAFRYDDDVPLCVPEINPASIVGKKLIANPNCTTAISSVVLYPIHKRYKISNIIVSTYQASSGAGAEGMEELVSGLKEYALTGDVKKPSVFPYQLPLNVIPHIDTFTENGYTKEEMKFLWETRKIFGDNSFGVSCTSVRVPTLRSHCASITIETVKQIDATDVRELLKKCRGVEVVDCPEKKEYPMPIYSSNKYNTHVGRIRQSLVFKQYGIDLFLSGDQLLKGAGLNAVQIAELL